MHFWDHSFSSPEANLAFDEAVLEHMDARTDPSSGDPSDNSTADPSGNSIDNSNGGELLRIWQMPAPCVVIGRSSRVSQEVDQEACARDGIAIFRRMSGGASIVAGPGCWMFSLLLSLEHRPECRALDGAHRTVMSRMRNAVQGAFQELGSDCRVGIQGICDLTVGGRKVSGNALRLKRNWMMYHGTLLIDMPLDWISRYLLEPPKQPEYRQKRSHRDFVESLGKSLADRAKFIELLSEQSRAQWQADREWSEHPFASLHLASVQSWIDRRYGDAAWHFQR